MRLFRFLWLSIALCLLVVASPASAQKKSSRDIYKQDVAFALDALEKECGHFFKLKGIKWKAVRSEFTKSSKKVTTDEEHFMLLRRLLARVKDGHASVKLGAKNQDFRLSEEVMPRLYGSGLFLTRIGKKYYVRNVRGDAEELRIKPGMEVVKVNKVKAAKWFADRLESHRDGRSFSTDHHADFFTRNRGMAHPQGTRLKLVLKDADGGTLKRTVTCTSKYYSNEGPVFFPAEAKYTKDLTYAVTPEGYGYIHIRRCKGNLPEQMDEALQGVGEVPGMILGFRGNPGGGFDHGALFSRFVPKGQVFSPGSKSYKSAGPLPFGGPLVVLVDGSVCSAGETASGMFKEEHRGYMIGETPTAGMSAQKTTIVLPSGKFDLYVAIGSNKSSYQGGRGIEGIGIEPHEIVPLDLDDLRAGRDTHIQRAVALLNDFPAKKVRYKPKKFGWSYKGK